MRSYMVVEHFFPGCRDAIYERFHSKGRMLPNGLEYVDSWLTLEGDKCFQLMRTDDFSLFEEWIEHWTWVVLRSWSWGQNHYRYQTVNKTKT